MTITSSTTSSTTSARDHARAQHTTVREQPTIPATDWPTPPDGVDAASMTWAETVPGGRYTTKVVARGTRLRLTDLDGIGCAQLFLWRADRPSERLNTADTVKVPWQAYLGAGHPLLSDQGRVLATIVDDTSGQHDTLCGASAITANHSRYGAGEPESNSPAGRELLALAAAKHGLDRTDLAAPVSLFHGVRVSADGGLVSIGNAGVGRRVELITHLPLIVAIGTAAHPLDPSPTYRVGAVEVLGWRRESDFEQLRDSLLDTDPEYQRAFLNSEDAWIAASR